jgi:hypothetical protein
MNVSREDVLAWLERERVCEWAVDWFRRSGLSFEDAWTAREMSGWLLLVASRAGVPGSVLRLCACDIAESVLHYVPEGEERPRRAIEVARRYAAGEATVAELDNAIDDARYATMSAASMQATHAGAPRSAAWSATRAAWKAAAMDDPWEAVLAAARDATRDAARLKAWKAAGDDAWTIAGDYAAHDAMVDAENTWCRLIRTRIPADVVLGLLAEKLREETHDA